MSYYNEGRDSQAGTIKDVPDVHWKDNPQAYRIRKVDVDYRKKLKQPLAAGGAAIMLRKK